jgi:hypothetical protein
MRKQKRGKSNRTIYRVRQKGGEVADLKKRLKSKLLVKRLRKDRLIVMVKMGRAKKRRGQGT